MTYTPTVIRLVQRGALSIPGGAVSASVAVASVNPNFASLRKLGASTTSGSSSDALAGIYLAGPSTITAFRQTATGVLVIDWELVEYLSVFVSRVQRGLTNTPNVTSAAQGIAAMNPARSLLHHLGNSTTDPASGNFSNEITRVEVTGATSITVYVGSPFFAQTTSWEVVEFR
jgi:hypothetical protein